MIKRPYIPSLTEEMHNLGKRREKETYQVRHELHTDINEKKDDNSEGIKKNRSYGAYFENRRYKQYSEKKKKIQARSKSASQQNSLSAYTPKSQIGFEVKGVSIAAKSIAHVKRNIFDQIEPHPISPDLCVVNPGAHPSKVAFKARTETLKRIEERRGPPDVNYNDILEVSRQLKKLETMKNIQET